MLMPKKITSRNHVNAPMQRASTKPHTGNCVSHTSIETTPNTNMETEKDISTLRPIALILVQRTEYRQIPPIGDLLVDGHETSMGIRLF